MKRLIAFLALDLSLVVLAACGNSTTSSGNQNTLDGEYYSEYRGEISSSPWVIIEGKTLTFYSGGKDDPSGTIIYSIDTENKTLSGEGTVENYTYENGVLSAKLGAGNSSDKYYNKDSEMYKKLKKNKN